MSTAEKGGGAYFREDTVLHVEVFEPSLLLESTDSMIMPICWLCVLNCAVLSDR
jgi:hypothetical protein